MATDILPITADHVILGDREAAVGRGYSASKDKNTIVRAFDIVVKGDVSTAGYDLVLVARSINFAPGARIVTSGADAIQKWLPGNKPTTSTTGQNGPTGLPGADGGDAGNVTIFADSVTGSVKVIAHGGVGGRGQDGGDGSVGADYPGPEEWIEEPWDRPKPRTAVGAPGQKGGNGGQAGPPGKSGNGGYFEIWLPNGATLPPVSVDLSGGVAPPAAQPGNWAAGGRGQAAPVYFFVPPGQPRTLRQKRGYGKPGPSIPGDYAPVQPIDPTAGRDGQWYGPSFLTPEKMAQQLTVDQLWLTVQEAERLYFNDQISDAKGRLEWVSELAASVTPA